MTKPIYDVVIIGSGPAGYTAAIYAARAQLRVALVAGDTWGGQLMLTSEVENYPGFIDGILGPELMKQMKDQAARFGAEFISEFVTKLEPAPQSNQPLRLHTADSQVLQARSVIITTGSQSKWLGLSSEKRLMAKGVTSCATCDGYFFRDKTVAVVGGGDTAMEESLELTKYASKVIIIHRRDSFRASKIMQERVLNHDKIEVIWNSEVSEVLGENFVNGLRLRDTVTKKEQQLSVDGLFVAIGHLPATAWLEGQLTLDLAGYIKTDGHTHTNMAGVFAAGDVADPRYRQAVTAAGDGCRAALEAERYLTDIESSEPVPEPVSENVA